MGWNYLLLVKKADGFNGRSIVTIYFFNPLAWNDPVVFTGSWIATLRNELAMEKTLVFHWCFSGPSQGRRIKRSRFSASPKMTGSSKNNVMSKRQHFICGAVLSVAVCGSVVPVCNASAGIRKEPNGRFNEFDTLLTVLALLLCIGGIFMCAWCTCCGHHDYFTILDQQRFQQQALHSNEV